MHTRGTNNQLDGLLVRAGRSQHALYERRLRHGHGEIDIC